VDDSAMQDSLGGMSTKALEKRAMRNSLIEDTLGALTDLVGIAKKHLLVIYAMTVLGILVTAVLVL
jgi:hypothetical protein